MLGVAALTVGVTVWFYSLVPKGFFPQQDTGMLMGTHRSGAGYLVRGHGEAAGQDRARSSWTIRRWRPSAPSSAAASRSSTVNNGRIFVTLKPIAERKVAAG